MINHDGCSLPGEETRAAEHAVPGRFRSQRRRMPFPMHHVGTGNMGEGRPSILIINIMQMIAPLVVVRRVGISRDGPIGSRIGKMVGQPGFRRVRRHGRHIILNRRRIGIGHRHTTTAHRNTGRHHLLLYRVHISTTFLLVCLIQNLTYGYHGFEAAIVQAFNSRTFILPPSLNRHTPTSPGA